MCYHQADTVWVFIRKKELTIVVSWVKENSLSVSGMEMITPFPVPTQRRFPPIRSAVIRTKEKPSLPVPVNHESELLREMIQWN